MAINQHKTDSGGFEERAKHFQTSQGETVQFGQVGLQLRGGETEGCGLQAV